MLVWMSNHLLVTPDPDGRWDDRHLKDALRAARLYGAFEVFGYPEGFDFHGVAATGIVEMGGHAPVVELRGRRPQVRELDPARPQPEIRLVLWHASDSGWVAVAESNADELVHPVEITWLGPRSCKAMEISLESVPMVDVGMV